MTPRYPLPLWLAPALLRDLLLKRGRSFHQDARRCVARLSPPLHVVQPENLPTRGPALIVTNHYSRPGFAAWWIALSISAVIPQEICWLMTAAWRHLGRLESLSRWLFPRLAEMYGFIPTPPMPPHPEETIARALSIHRLLRHARTHPAPLIGLAPEGQDHPGGALGAPPAGVGRLIAMLLPYCQRIHPIGVYEDNGHLSLQCGPPFRPPIPTNAAATDQQVSYQVMQAIAAQLPASLRGSYAGSR